MVGLNNIEFEEIFTFEDFELLLNEEEQYITKRNFTLQYEGGDVKEFMFYRESPNSGEEQSTWVLHFNLQDAPINFWKKLINNNITSYQ